MPSYIALLRGINVGGKGKLPMAELAELCESQGCKDVKTYIQSGNVVFTSRSSPANLQKKLEKALADKMGKPIAVMVRTAAEMESIATSNPFPTAPLNKVVVFFFQEEAAAESFAEVEPPGKEEIVQQGSEVFIHYPDGQGKSKLKLPATGTGRNLNTVNKLVSLSRRK
ncbi:Hypothetical protein PBC10988_22740 [Planctomycetales bacterium 10988]|nr:Hypothetical protein PBC10988_22740 [Planctomycetales bacterium 10988]